MSANNLVRPAGFTLHSEVSAAEMQALQVQAASSVNRNGTVSGEMNYPLIIAGQGLSSGTVVAYYANGELVCNSTTVMSGGVSFALDRLPDGQQLTGIRMYIIPDTGHTGIPAYPPTLVLYRITKLGVCTSQATATAVIATVAASNAPYYVTIPESDLGIQVDNGSYRYVVVFRPEAGTDAIAGAKVGSLLITMDVDASYGDDGGRDFSHWLAAVG